MPQVWDWGPSFLNDSQMGVVAQITYASHTLQPHEARYGVSELEALAVVWVTRHLRVYLYGHPCDVCT